MVQSLVEEFLESKEYSKAIAASDLLVKLVDSYASICFVEKEQKRSSSSLVAVAPEVQQVNPEQNIQPVAQEQVFVQRASYKWNDGWNGKNGNSEDMWNM